MSQQVKKKYIKYREPDTRIANGFQHRKNFVTPIDYSITSIKMYVTERVS